MPTAKANDRLEERLRNYQTADATLSTILRLHQHERELFYELYALSPSEDIPEWLRGLQRVTQQLQRMSRRALTIEEQGEHGCAIVRAGDDTVTCSREELHAFSDFWGDITGLSTGVEGHCVPQAGSVSDAELAFKLGKPSDWSTLHKRVDEYRNEKPLILQLDEEDRIAVTQGMPAYVAYELRYCATRIVEAPTIVFQGLRKGFKRGRAYCGRAPRRYDNHGNSRPAPERLVYLVYTDEENYVFDWDWVQADPKHSGYPINWEERFQKKLDPVTAVIHGVDNIKPGKFDPNHAWYSRRGNCVFVYFSDEPGFAERLNEDVTIFRNTDLKILGCKIKNIDKSVLKEEDVGAERFLAQSLLRNVQPREEYLRLFAEMAENAPTVRAHAGHVN